MMQQYMKELEQEPFDAEEFVERLAWRTIAETKIDDEDDLNPTLLHESFVQAINDLTLLQERQQKKCQKLETAVREDEAMFFQEIYNLLEQNKQAINTFQELDEKINHVATKVLHLGDQLDSVNGPRSRVVDAHRLLTHLGEFLSTGPLISSIFTDPYRIDEAADIIQKLYLISQDLPPKFDSVKRKIERKYCDIEKNLIEDFVNAMNDEDLKRMREIAIVLSQFKGYSQCVDAYIDQSQAGCLSSKDVFGHLLTLCKYNYDIIQKVFNSPEQVMAKFVLNIYQLKIAEHIEQSLSSKLGSYGYLQTLYELYSKTNQLSNDLTIFDMGNDKNFLNKLSSNIFNKYISDYITIGGPPGALYERSKSGWINEELFTKWLHHFPTNIGAHAQNPALLILDNHCSHQSHDAYEFCREKGIHLLSLPPHTSHKMQPLDVTFYGPLKSAYSRECDLFMKMHPFEKITHDHLASIFNKAYTRVATMEKAVKGFEVTGIYPLNPHIFDDEDILTADPIIEEAPRQVSESGVENEFIEPVIGYDESIHSQPSSPSILDRPNEITPHTPQRQTDQNPVDLITEETASGIPFNSNKNANMPSAVLSESMRKYITEPSTSQRILEDLNPIPQKTIKIQRRVKKQHSIILTSTPLKEQLEEKERKRQMKIAKEKNVVKKKVEVKKPAKEKSAKRKVLNSSESSEDEDCMKSKKKKPSQGKKKAKVRSKKCIDSSSEDSMDDVPLTQLCDDDEDDDIENRDICAVWQEFGRDGEMWFRCCRCSNWIH